MPKRKHVQEIVSSGPWKTVEFKKPFSLDHDSAEQAPLEEDPFEGLIEIEELTDYEIGPADGGAKKIKILAGGAGVEDVRQPSKKKLRSEKRAEERRCAKKVARANRRKEKSLQDSHLSDHDTEESAVVNAESADPSSSGEKLSEKKKKAAKIKAASSKEETGTEISAADEDTDEVLLEDPIDLSEWEELNVCPSILKALGEMKFTTPSPIQKECLPPAIRSRKDIIGAAETGSGKTLAFAIPILQNILEDKLTETDKEAALRALIITPTRELASQILNHITTVGKYTGVTTCLVVGGMFKEKQDRLLEKRPDIVIATPGRLFEHIQNQTPYLKTLSSIRYLVIDEADRMVERGHFKELTDIMQIFSADVRAATKRQTFVFSATLGMEVETFKSDRKSHSKRPPKVAAEPTTDSRVDNLFTALGLKKNAVLVDLSKPEGTAGSLLERRLPCTLKDKDYLFYYLLMTEATGRVIVFCNSLDCVRRLHGVFSYLLTETGRTPLVLHAGMHQKQRLKNLERFQANNKAILLASDVAARGLDIPDVQFVIHYQVPRNPDLYVHRSGRTARAFKVGSSVLLVDPSDAPAAEKILKCLHRDRDFPMVDVNSKMLRFAKERVDLARRIDVVEHALRKESSKDEWYLKAAEESDLLLDKDDKRRLEIQKGDGRSRQSKEAKGLKRLMKSVLAQPVKSRMPGFSLQYPTLNFAKSKLGFS